MYYGSSLQRLIKSHGDFVPLIPPEVTNPQDVERIIASAPSPVLARSYRYGSILRALILGPSKDQTGE